jgi:hypothetical protein
MHRLVGVPVRLVGLVEQVERHVLLVRHRADRARPVVLCLTTAIQAVVDELASG